MHLQDIVDLYGLPPDMVAVVGAGYNNDLFEQPIFHRSPPRPPPFPGRAFSTRFRPCTSRRVLSPINNTICSTIHRITHTTYGIHSYSNGIARTNLAEPGRYAAIQTVGHWQPVCEDQMLSISNSSKPYQKPVLPTWSSSNCTASTWLSSISKKRANISRWAPLTFSTNCL